VTGLVKFCGVPADGETVAPGDNVIVGFRFVMSVPLGTVIKIAPRFALILSTSFATPKLKEIILSAAPESYQQYVKPDPLSAGMGCPGPHGWFAPFIKYVILKLLQAVPSPVAPEPQFQSPEEE